MDHIWRLIPLLTGLLACYTSGSDNTGANDGLSFLVIGDWGGLPSFPYRTLIEEAVANHLGNLAESTASKFVLALGDNFYFDGVSSVKDPRFQETYESVFKAVHSDINWYLIAGNHDHNGNVTAQIAYSNLDKRWNYPDLYYTLGFTIPGSAKTFSVVMIDTVVLCGNSDHDMLYKQPEMPGSPEEAEKQWTWIENQLKKNRAEYLLVAGHYPVFSVAEHGPTGCLVERLMPLLYKYNVTAYLSGHDHNLQHLQYTKHNHTVDYFVSGAANFMDASTEHKGDIPPGSFRFHWADMFSLGGLAHVHVTDSIMTWTFVESNGKTLYRHKMLPRRING